MWFSLSLLALTMLVVRRSTEKQVTKSIDSSTLSWLQQAVALPFIVLTLFFARFYVPTELTQGFWQIMVVYVLCSAVDLYCYFKALTIADISYVAPMLSLISVGNIVGAYFVLGQQPTLWGLGGAFLIVAGAYIINRAKMKHGRTKGNALALMLVMILVVVRAYYSNIEIFMLREVNPTTFNFYSSILTVPVLLIFAYSIHKHTKGKGYFKTVATSFKSNILPLIFIGVTYTINLTATYAAKLMSPNAGYVGAIKSAQVLPMMLIGALMFHERISKAQWGALALILGGLALISFN